MALVEGKQRGEEERARTLDVSLDEHRPELAWRGEPFNLLVGDGSHKSSLAAVVAAEQSVPEQQCERMWAVLVG